MTDQHARTSRTVAARKIPARRILVTAMVAALCALAGGVTHTASAATTAGGPTGWIRAGHLSLGTPKADVRLTPFEGGRPEVLANVSFGQLTDYERVPTGLYTVSLVRAGSPMSAAPMISQNVRVSEGGAATVVATGSGDDVRTTVLADDLTAPPTGQAKVRLLSAATDPATIDATVVGGPSLAQDVATGSSTGYADVDAQTWSIEIAGSDGTGAITRRVPVEAGGVYTLVALDGVGGELELRAVQDSASSTAADGAMPSGGVDTGAGGLSPGRTGDAHGHDPVTALTASVLGSGSLALIGLVGVLGLRRRLAAA